MIQPELPEYKVSRGEKGTQDTGTRGRIDSVQEEAPEYTNPVVTKGTQEPGHEGESVVREEIPEYTKPLETKAKHKSQDELRVSSPRRESRVHNPVSTKGTQEPDMRESQAPP